MQTSLFGAVPVPARPTRPPPPPPPTEPPPFEVARGWPHGYAPTRWQVEPSGPLAPELMARRWPSGRLAACRHRTATGEAWSVHADRDGESLVWWGEGDAQQVEAGTLEGLRRLAWSAWKQDRAGGGE